MDKLKKDDLEKLKIDIDECIKQVKEISANYDSKIHYNKLTQSTISSVNSTINSIINSTEYLEGYYLMCDEINPLALTEYLIELKNYKVDKDILSYYVSFYLKRRINSFYKDLKVGIVPIGAGVTLDKKGLKKYYNNCYERATNGLKLLRSKK